MDNLAMREGHERYRLLKKLAADGIFIVQDGLIKESNPSMAKLCGCSQEDLMDSSLSDFFLGREMPANNNPIDYSTKISDTSNKIKTTLKSKSCGWLKIEIFF